MFRSTVLLLPLAACAPALDEATCEPSAYAGLADVMVEECTTLADADGDGWAPTVEACGTPEEQPHVRGSSDASVLGGTIPAIAEVSVDGGGPMVTRSHGGAVEVELELTMDCVTHDCGGAIRQVLVGVGGRGDSDACVHSGVGHAGPMDKWATVSIPDAPGVYSIRYAHTQAYSCDDAGAGWWRMRSISPTTTIGVVEVTAECGVIDATDTGLEDTSSAVEPPCPNVADLDGHSYSMCSFRGSAYEAADTCEAAGMHLVKVDSYEENAWLRDWIRADGSGQAFWLGISDAEVEGDWRWHDQSTPQFTAWSPGEPNNAGNEDCAAFRSIADGTWNDISCDLQAAFICEG
ncbi:MAG: C-type lectin domain-containing protein [Proteobacteria bacterium]|nr:C-type lectin domain-containing protein [Pseudomonadota bacterium]